MKDNRIANTLSVRQFYAIKHKICLSINILIEIQDFFIEIIVCFSFINTFAFR